MSETSAEKKPQGLLSYTVAVACFVVVTAGLKAADQLVVPLLLAAFLAAILSPPLSYLKRLGISSYIGLLLIAITLSAIGFGIVLLVGKSFNEFSARLPEYRRVFDTRSRVIESWLKQRGLELPERDETRTTVKPDTEEENPVEVQEPPVTEKEESLLSADWAVSFFRGVISGLGGLFSSGTIVLITLIFMLLEAARLPDKLRAAFGEDNHRIEHLQDILRNVRRYMMIKTATSLLTGLLAAGLLALLDQDYALLWGLFAFLLNYVPNIGSILAAIPPVLLALVDPGGGITSALLVAFGYLVINCFISYAVEPRFMGQGLGLSTLVVFLSLIFWGWVLGPIGMLLSAPLTMIVKIILFDYEETRWISILMGSRAPASD